MEGFKQESLADMTYDLLAHAQQQESEAIKKEQVTCNDQSLVTIKTSHGQFEFPNQRFAFRTGQKGFSWLEHTGQFRDGYESERLRSRCCYDANRMSYSEVSTLLKDETGEFFPDAMKKFSIPVVFLQLEAV